MNKEFENLASILQVIAVKNSLLYPIDDFVIRLRGSFNGTFSWLALKMGYTVGCEDASIFISFQYHESNSEV